MDSDGDVISISSDEDFAEVGSDKVSRIILAYTNEEANSQFTYVGNQRTELMTSSVSVMQQS